MSLLRLLYSERKTGEDDPVQRKDEEYAGGANAVNLKQARKNYIEFGACDQRHKQYVRPQFDHEKSEID